MVFQLVLVLFWGLELDCALFSSNFIFSDAQICRYRIVYRLMQKQIRDLRESPALADELAADALEDAEEGAPLLRDFSSESVNEVERSPGRRSS